MYGSENEPVVRVGFLEYGPTIDKEWDIEAMYNPAHKEWDEFVQAASNNWTEFKEHFNLMVKILSKT